MFRGIKRELLGPQVRVRTRDSRSATGKQSEPLAGQLVCAPPACSAVRPSADGWSRVQSEHA